MQQHVIIVAAGQGTRFGGDIPKQFAMLGDKPVLMHTIIRIARALPKARLTIVLSRDYFDFWERACAMHGFTSPRVVTGGNTRWQSVKNAIETISTEVSDDDIVLIHDGARPVVPSDMLKRLVTTLDNGADAAIPAISISDSLRTADQEASVPIDRAGLVAVQTPQAFRAGRIINAYNEDFDSSFTDEASVYQHFTGRSPLLIEGSPLNIKITHPRDIDIAALYLGLRN